MVKSKNAEVEAVVKKIKSVVVELGENLKANRFDEAYENANILKKKKKNELLLEMTGKELEQELHFEELKQTLKRYWYNNKQKRMYEGGLRKNGEVLLSLLN